MTAATTVKLFLSGAVVLAAVGCAPIVEVHGNLVDAEHLGEIHRGVSRKNDVANVLGTPTATTTLEAKQATDANTWYYIGQRSEKVAFFPPEVVERKVVVVRFDPAGVVSSVEKYDLSSGRDVDIVSRITPTAGKDLSFIEQMLSNVGRFSGNKKEGPGAPRS